jgi:hypothetical protein
MMRDMNRGDLAETARFITDKKELAAFPRK